MDRLLRRIVGCISFRWMTYGLAGACVAIGLTAVPHGQGQVDKNLDPNDNLKYARGQNVVPAFEGWVANPDGTYSLVFGYFNRNWQEELFIPIGPNNHIDPGGPDRGQPTAFLPRRGKNFFEIVVPKDFGDKTVTWTLISRGKEEKAYGRLVKPEVLTRRMVQAGGALQESAIDGNDDAGDEASPNKPPSVHIDSVPPISLPGRATLNATVIDDGVASRRGGGGGRGRGGLRVTWLEYRGPAHVGFDPAVNQLPDPKGGKITTTANFKQPGTYVLRASARDIGGLEANTDVTVTVK